MTLRRVLGGVVDLVVSCPRSEVPEADSEDVMFTSTFPRLLGIPWDGIEVIDSPRS